MSSSAASSPPSAPRGRSPPPEAAPPASIADINVAAFHPETPGRGRGATEVLGSGGDADDVFSTEQAPSTNPWDSDATSNSVDSRHEIYELEIGSS